MGRRTVKASMIWINIPWRTCHTGRPNWADCFRVSRSNVFSEKSSAEIWHHTGHTKMTIHFDDKSTYGSSNLSSLDIPGCKVRKRKVCPDILVNEKRLCWIGGILPVQSIRKWQNDSIKCVTHFNLLKCEVGQKFNQLTLQLSNASIPIMFIFIPFYNMWHQQFGRHKQ